MVSFEPAPIEPIVWITTRADWDANRGTVYKDCVIHGEDERKVRYYRPAFAFWLREDG